MSCPTMRYTHAPGIRLRPVPEFGNCVVFAAGEQRLFRLNAHAWLLLELCRDAPEDGALRAAYLEAVMPPLEQTAAEASFEAGLDLLLGHKLLQRREAAVVAIGG